MSLFHKKIDGAIAAVDKGRFDRAVSIIEEHLEEEQTAVGIVGGLKKEIGDYDTHMRTALDMCKGNNKAAEHLLLEAEKNLKFMKVAMKRILANLE